MISQLRKIDVIHAKKGMKPNLSLYIITRFASQANQRTIQLLRLREVLPRVVLVSQSRGSTYADAYHLYIEQYSNLPGVFRRLGFPRMSSLIERNIYFPSADILYVMPARKGLEREIRKDLQEGRNVCIITCVPPHALVLIGLHLKRRFPQIYWIIDWQDLWSHDRYYFGRLPGHHRDKARRLEQQVLNACDMNVVTNVYAQAVLQERYRVPAAKVQAIYHAFDPSDFIPSSRTNTNKGVSGNPIKIGFLGNLFKPPKVPGREILDALGHVRNRGIDLVFYIYGDKYLEKVTRRPVEGLQWVVVHNRMSHEESLRKISGCDFLLVTLANLPDTQVIVPIKLPFYFLLNKPILALVPDTSIVAEMIRETGTGFVIPTDREDWGTKLADLLIESRKHGIKLRRDEEAIERYSWSYVSQQWLELISNSVDTEDNVQ